MSFWDDRLKQTRIYGMFMREDPSIVKTVPAQLAVFDCCVIDIKYIFSEPCTVPTAHIKVCSVFLNI